MESTRNGTTAYLIQIIGKNANRNFQFTCPKIKIGRSSRAEIRLENPGISPLHCTISSSENGWMITDNKSLNGTYISGCQLKPHKPRLLECGDVICLGSLSDTVEAFCFNDSSINDEYISDMINRHAIIELTPIKRPAKENMTDLKKKRLKVENTNSGSHKTASSLIKSRHVKETGDVLVSKKIHDSLKLGDIESRDLHDVMSSSVLSSEDSRSSINMEKNEVIDPYCLFSSEVGIGHRSFKQMLKDLLTLLSEQNKRLELSKLDLQECYGILWGEEFFS